MIASATQCWFGPGFVDRDPDASAALLAALADARKAMRWCVTRWQTSTSPRDWPR
jgi:hypothetical protein